MVYILAVLYVSLVLYLDKTSEKPFKAKEYAQWFLTSKWAVIAGAIIAIKAIQLTTIVLGNKP